jgi:F-type H+-transporting ATPase subunit epsilon
MLKVTIMSTIKIIFKGEAESVILPGDMGVFEVMSFHKRLMSRLLRGAIDVDGQTFLIARGIAKVDRNNLMIVVEEE